MNAQNNGGPAFPVSTGDYERGHQDGHTTWQYPGMTLRDYFAAKVLQARMTAFSALEMHHGWTGTEIAADAYLLADAMLKAREPATSEVKHTPGPWFAVQYARSHAWRITRTPDSTHGDLCNVLAGLGAPVDEQVAANARLIAAAPELLEAAEQALSECVDLIATPAGEALALAIAKATGGQP